MMGRNIWYNYEGGPVIWLLATDGLSRSPHFSTMHLSLLFSFCSPYVYFSFSLPELYPNFIIHQGYYLRFLTRKDSSLPDQNDFYHFVKPWLCPWNDICCKDTIPIWSFATMICITAKFKCTQCAHQRNPEEALARAAQGWVLIGE